MTYEGAARLIGSWFAMVSFPCVDGMMAVLNDRESRKLHDIEKEDNNSCSVVLPIENDGRPKSRTSEPSQCFCLSIHYNI